MSATITMVSTDGKVVQKTIDMGPTVVKPVVYVDVDPSDSSVTDGKHGAPTSRKAANTIKHHLLPTLSAEQQRVYQMWCSEQKVSDLLTAVGDLSTDDQWIEWLLWLRTKGRFVLKRDPEWTKDKTVHEIAVAAANAKFAGQTLMLNFIEILAAHKGSKTAALSLLDLAIELEKKTIKTP